MHCASCAGLIEKELHKVDGVSEASVNFAAEKAYVTHDAGMDSSALISAVQKAGYSASDMNMSGGEAHHDMHDHAPKNLKAKVLTAALLSVPMLYFMITDFFPGLPGALTVSPYAALISFLLTTYVLFVVGQDFYKGMWSGLRMRTFNMDSLIAIGASVAYLYSFVVYGQYVIGSGTLIAEPGMKIDGLYFETAAFLVAFVL
jgi:Cu+-exporting ATPase